MRGSSLEFVSLPLVVDCGAGRTIHSVRAGIQIFYAIDAIYCFGQRAEIEHTGRGTRAPLITVRGIIMTFVRSNESAKARGGQYPAVSYSSISAGTARPGRDRVENAFENTVNYGKVAISASSLQSWPC
jgi:hypothetical protein